MGLDAEWDEEVGYFMGVFTYPDGKYETEWSAAACRETLWSLEDDGCEFALHAGGNDFRALDYYPRRTTRVWNTCNLAWLYNENPPHGLKEIAPVWLGRELVDPLVRKEKKCWFRASDNKLYRLADAPQDEVENYCRSDSLAARDLVLPLWNALPERMQDWYLNVECALDRATYKMEKRGVYLHEESRRALEAKLGALENEYEARLHSMISFPFNVRSDDQIAAIMFNKEWTTEERQVVGKYKNGNDKYGKVQVLHPGLALVHPKKKSVKTGKYSVDATTLESYRGHPFVDLLLEYRGVQKLNSTYVQAFPRFTDEASRLHGRFNTTGTVTGRLSSNSPK